MGGAAPVRVWHRVAARLTSLCRAVILGLMRGGSDSFMSSVRLSGMHRTTFRIDEEILAEAKALAARQHRSLNSVMEEALRRMINSAHERETRPRVTLPTSGTPGVPHPTWEQIKEILEEED